MAQAPVLQHEAPPSDRPLPGARSALVLLLLINLFNYIDRYVLAAVEPNIRQRFVADDPNAQLKMGMLSTAFMAMYLISAPIFGVLAERISRWLLIGVGVILWTAASGVSGLAPTYLVLLITRCFVGVGEGAYGPVAPTVISDLYPVQIRGKVLAWFYAAIPVGSALGFALGGQVAGMSALGPDAWRWAFYIVVPPGLVLGAWALFRRDPPASAADAPREGALEVGTGGRSANRWRKYLLLGRVPSYLLNCAGMTAMTFAMGGIAFWMPSYLEAREVPYTFGIAPATLFGLITAGAGLAATLAGGWAGDRLRSRFGGSYFLVSGVAMIAGVPCFLLLLATPFPQAWIFVFLAVFLLFFNTGPTNTALANCTPPAIRATAFAINILVIHVLGDAISPPIIGAIADHFRTDPSNATRAYGLGVGFAVVSVFMLIGGVIWLWASRHLERDTARAPGLLIHSDSPN